MALSREFETALLGFIAKCAEVIRKHYVANGFNMTPPSLSYEAGPKYVRVVRGDGTSRSVHCFVEIATGNVLKADGWKRPAKASRGNIYAENPVAGMGPYGAAYLR